MKSIANIKGIALIGLLSTLLLLSCNRKDADYIGPAFVGVPDGFNVTGFSATPSPVDFTTDSVVFSATFSHKVSFILRIVGNQSGAVREFRGLADNLNINNANWKGFHDGLTYFRVGEDATATLSFFGTSDTYTTTISISVVRDFTSCGTFPQDADFETPANIVGPNWVPFNSAGATQGVGATEVDYNGKTVTPVQGSNYYYIRGQGVQNEFVDGIRYDGPLNPALPANPDNVWVNVYVYGTGDPNLQINFEMKEADFDGGTAGYQDNEDDSMVATIFADHSGWKLFSFKYSNLSPSLAASFGGSGNKIYEPDRVVGVQVGLLKAVDPNSPVEVYFDFPIITVGGPYVPSECD